jgi:hypothetical protein
MAEQSIGMATGTGSTFGDGNVGSGYATSRMIAMESKTLSDGVLQTGSLLALGGSGTNTITVAAGAAIVGGYFYENTSSASLVVTSLPNTNSPTLVYYVAIVAFTGAGTLTVARSVSGTTVASNTVRVVVANNTQVAAWVTAGYSYLILAGVTMSGGIATVITPDYTMYGTTKQIPYQAYASMGGGIATLTTANVQYELSSFNTPVSSGEGIIVADNVNNSMTVKRAGMYLITAFCSFTSGTTGNRAIIINVNGSTVSSTRAASSGVSSHTMTQTAIHVLAANDEIKIGVLSSLAGQSVSLGLFNVVRV